MTRRTVEIIVTDWANAVVQTFRLANVSVSRSPSDRSAPQKSMITSVAVTF
ncbi:MAG TPA: hypothetical protein PKD26_08115 [Pyrinomonadaceae bacterium]|nr:hypothetical protein [Pyrinomonadaceae bacterium]